MTGQEFSIKAADILLPLADDRAGIIQAFDIVDDEKDVARLAVTVGGQQYEITQTRDGRPDALAYERMLRAAQDFADQRKGTSR